MIWYRCRLRGSLGYIFKSQCDTEEIAVIKLYPSRKAHNLQESNDSYASLIYLQSYPTTTSGICSNLSNVCCLSMSMFVKLKVCSSTNEENPTVLHCKAFGNANRYFIQLARLVRLMLDSRPAAFPCVHATHMNHRTFEYCVESQSRIVK